MTTTTDEIRVYTDESSMSEFYTCDRDYLSTHPGSILQCEVCGDFFDASRVNMTHTHYGYACPICFRDTYTHCAACGNLILVEDSNYDDESGEDFCNHCYNEILERRNSCIIWGYHDYPMDWEFRGKDDELHFGVELEIEGGGECGDHAIAITTAMGFPANEGQELICSHDGSLYNGFEIITQPSTYDYLVNAINWEAGLTKARELNYVSHNGGHCGLHVHMDIGYFLKNRLYANRHDLENNVATLLLVNSSWLKKFCRRNKWTYCEFPDYGEIKYLPQNPRDVFRSIGRYSAANFLPYNTIEFRFMRGTLIPSTFKAALQLMSLIGKALATHRSVDSIRNVYFSWFLDAADKLGYNEFIKEYFNRCTGIEPCDEPAGSMVF